MLHLLALVSFTLCGHHSKSHICQSPGHNACERPLLAIQFTGVIGVMVALDLYLILKGTRQKVAFSVFQYCYLTFKYNLVVPEFVLYTLIS